MSKKKYITWRAGKSLVILYTEYPEIYKILRNVFKRCTAYERNGKSYAWQFIFENSDLEKIKRMINDNFEISGYENNVIEGNENYRTPGVNVGLILLSQKI